MLTDQTIIWRRLDHPGHEAARLLQTESGPQLTGTAVFLYAAQPCRLDYELKCDSSWNTCSAKVAGWVGSEVIEIEITVNADRRWWLNGAESSDVLGCIDLDLNFSPSTNLLPIRRLNLGVDEERKVHAAWLRFPSFKLELLEQVYRRTGASTYRYESSGGKFAVDLQVDQLGFVTSYPQFWEAEGLLASPSN